MDGIALASYLYKVLREREQELADALANDVAKDWEHYKSLVGEIRGLSYARSELKTLLENNAEDVEDLISS